MLNINLSDNVSVEFNELGEYHFNEFAALHKQYPIIDKGAQKQMPFLALMHLLTSHQNEYILEDECFFYNHQVVFLNCNAKVNFTDKGTELFGYPSMSNQITHIFNWIGSDTESSEWDSLLDGALQIDEDSYHSLLTYSIDIPDPHGRITKGFCLEHHNQRIVLLEPNITPYRTYSFDSMKDSMYFYYDILIEDNINYRAGAPHWKTVTRGYVYECGVIEHLASVIDGIMQLDIEKEGKIIKNEYRNIAIAYDMLNGFCAEDNYEIFRYKNLNNGHETYDFSCFVGNDQVSSNITGVRFNNLRKQDLSFIKQWAQNFLDYAEDVTRRIVKKQKENAENNKKIINGKLYLYNDNIKDGVDYQSIETIFLPGDKCSFRTNEIDYGIFVIKKLIDNYIVDENNKKYPLKEVLYISNEIDGEKLSYNREQCKIEIKKYLEDVLDLPTDSLISAAIDTCWMCRSEHGFDDARTIAAEIIEELKSEKKYEN